MTVIAGDAVETAVAGALNAAGAKGDGDNPPLAAAAPPPPNGDFGEFSPLSLFPNGDFGESWLLSMPLNGEIGKS